MTAFVTPSATRLILFCKIATEQFLRPELLASQTKRIGVAVAGELASPSTSLSKNFFDKLRRDPFVTPQAVEKPLESSRGPEPSRTTIVPGGVNGGDGRIFAAENSIFQSKNRFFAVFAAGIRRIQAKTGEGGREAENPLGFQVSPLAKLPTAQIVDLRRGTWPGSLLPRPPACQKTILTSGGVTPSSRRFFCL